MPLNNLSVIPLKAKTGLRKCACSKSANLAPLQKGTNHPFNTSETYCLRKSRKFNIDYLMILPDELDDAIRKKETGKFYLQ